MCGIAGGIRHTLSGESEATQVLQRLRHRGPDGNGLWQGEQIWLANTRLAIQDLSAAGAQPMRTADKNYIIVYNGELYNAATLRKRLEAEGVCFYTRCDTEVLLNAFAAWGPDCLNDLEGDFAFAVWNRLRQELFIARDPSGVKPLYVYDDGRQVVFASEMKALLGLQGLDYSLKPEVFYDYLLYLYSPSDATPFRHIRKLLPGHFIRTGIDAPTTVPRRYHQPDFEKLSMPGSEWMATLEQTLVDAVKRQLYADAPVGIMLSGGLDSSLIAAIAKVSAPDKALQAYTIDSGGGMAGEGFKDDLAYARLMSRSLNMPLREVSGAFVPSGQWIDTLVYDLDEPQADPAAMYTAAIASAAREQGIKVLLSGTGGDDVFSGYRRHAAIPGYHLMHWLPKALGRWPSALLKLTGNTSPGLRRFAKMLSAAGLSARDAAIHSHFWAAPERICNLFADRSATSGNRPYATFRSLLDQLPAGMDLLEQMLMLEQQTFLPHHNLAYMDKMGMAHSVEIRVPFVDKSVIALAAHMPSSLKMRGGETKAALRSIARKYLPAEIITRGKTGFGAPLREWMQGPMAHIVRERLTDATFVSRGIFDASAIAQLIHSNERGQADNAYILFSLVCIESWLRQFAPDS